MRPNINEENILENDKKETKIIPFQIITGGKGPTGENWLSELKTGTVFLVEKKNNPMDFTLGVFQKMLETETATLLRNALSNSPDDVFWVKTRKFSIQMGLVEVLHRHFEEIEREDIPYTAGPEGAEPSP